MQLREIQTERSGNLKVLENPLVEARGHLCLNHALESLGWQKKQLDEGSDEGFCEV